MGKDVETLGGLLVVVAVGPGLEFAAKSVVLSPDCVLPGSAGRGKRRCCVPSSLPYANVVGYSLAGLVVARRRVMGIRTGRILQHRWMNS